MSQPGPADVHTDSLATKRRNARKKSKWKSPVKGRPTLKWPHLYDILRDKEGMSAEKAARISNAQRGKRKKGRLWTKAGNKAAEKRARAKKLAKSYMVNELVAGYLEPEEIAKVSTKAGMGFRRRRKARRKSVGVRGVRQRRIGRAHPMPRKKHGVRRAETPTARGRHGRNY
jgi:hypothetical protein